MSGRRRVHQLLPALSWGDAVGNHVLHLQALLRARGVESEIFAGRWDEKSAGHVHPAKELPDRCDAESVVLIHHSFESHFVPILRKTGARAFMLYHNVTPAHLFDRYDRGLAGACRAARVELRELASLCERAFAYSRFSAEELTAAGYPAPEVLPFTVDWKAFDAPPDAQFGAQFDDGRTNLLFVGRAVPNKRVEDVLRVFTAYQRLYDRDARLLIAGQLTFHSPYVSWLREVRTALGAESVHLLGKVTQGQLSALFHAAHVYLSMSHHEGFGVPLIEAMYRGVPVVAYGAAAVPETLGGAGVTLLTEDPIRAAEVLAVLHADPSLRDQVLAGQRERLRAFDDEAVSRAVDEVLMPAIATPTRRTPLIRPAERVVVCPGFAQADGVHARQALAEASRSGARVLALRAEPRPGAACAPEVLVRDGVEVHLHAPELPWRGLGPPPYSSSLETAVLSARGEIVWIDSGGELETALLPSLRNRVRVQSPDRVAQESVRAAR